MTLCNCAVKYYEKIAYFFHMRCLSVCLSVRQITEKDLYSSIQYDNRRSIYRHISNEDGFNSVYRSSVGCRAPFIVNCRCCNSILMA